MKFLTVLPFVVATLIAGVAADFQIFYVEDLTYDADGNPVTTDSIMVFDGTPSCDDVDFGYASFPVVADASTPGYSRCDGCGDWVDITTWDIQELEINDDGGWGHYTIYEGAGYQLTPADGGPLEGYCTRDSNDYFDCTTGVDSSHGQRLFSCSSLLAGIHAS